MGVVDVVTHDKERPPLTRRLPTAAPVAEPLGGDAQLCLSRPVSLGVVPLPPRDAAATSRATHLAADQRVGVHDAGRQARHVAVAHGSEVRDHIGQRHEDVVAGHGRRRAGQLLVRGVSGAEGTCEGIGERGRYELCESVRA